MAQTPYETHSALMSGMADRLGADLDEAELRGAITPGIRNDMVLKCTGCTHPEDCRQVLEAKSDFNEPPIYCRNGEALVELANDLKTG